MSAQADAALACRSRMREGVGAWVFGSFAKGKRQVVLWQGQNPLGCKSLILLGYLCAFLVLVG